MSPMIARISAEPRAARRVDSDELIRGLVDHVHGASMAHRDARRRHQQVVASRPRREHLHVPGIGIDDQHPRPVLVGHQQIAGIDGRERRRGEQEQ